MPAPLLPAMCSNRSRVRGGPWLAFLFLGCVAGCDLAAYEKRMEAEDQRFEYFDQENRYLDDPIELPKKKDEKPAGTPGAIASQPEAVFVRPPRGTRHEPWKQVPGTQLLWEYYHNPPAPAFFFAVDPSKDKILADVKVRFGPLGFDAGRFRQETLQGTGRPPVNYDHFESPQLDVYLAGGNPNATAGPPMMGAGGLYVAIAFQFDRQKALLGDQITAMRYSVQSLAFGRAAQVLRQVAPKTQTRPMNPTPPPPATNLRS